MKQEIIIDRKEHSFAVLGRVAEMRSDRRYCDFTIKVGSEEIHAHQNILASGSDYFDKMLSHDTIEKESGVVEMKGVDTECTIVCVDHIYGGKVFIPDGKFEEMIHAADLMQLHTLSEATEALLLSNLDAESFFSAKRIANLYGCKKLAEECKVFALKNFLEISKQEGFRELPKNYIKKMMKSQKIKMSEEEKLKAVLRWIKHSSERSEFIMEMVRVVKLSDVPVVIRRHLIENEQLINGNKDCLLHFSISVMDSLEVRQLSQDPFQQAQSGVIVFDGASGHLQCFCPKDNSWTKMHEMNDEMKSQNCTSVRLDDHIYVLTENRSVYRLKFSDETASWKRKANMIERHGEYPPAVALLGEIYVIGGFLGENSRVVEKYNPDSNQWTRLPDKSETTTGSAVVAFNGCIYSFGGHSGNEYKSTIEVFDPSSPSSSWKVVGSMNERKTLAGAVKLGDNIYILGGFTGEVASTVECFDVKMNQCTILKSMNVFRWIHVACVIGGAIYSVGGLGSDTSIEKYDVAKNEWEMVELPENLRLQIKASVQI